jgi:hypothetical protein
MIILFRKVSFCRSAGGNEIEAHDAITAMVKMKRTLLVQGDAMRFRIPLLSGAN